MQNKEQPTNFNETFRRTMSYLLEVNLTVEQEERTPMKFQHINCSPKTRRHSAKFSFQFVFTLLFLLFYMHHVLNLK